MTNEITKVAAGEKVRASTINQIIDRYPSFHVEGDGSVVENGTQVNFTIGKRTSFSRGGQTFRQPFDLSTNNCLSGADELSMVVIRSHLPNENGGFTDIPVGDPITFPQQEDVSFYLCELSSGGQKVMSSIDDGLSAAKTKKTLWKIKTNGVVLEDSRAAALGGEGDKIDLDLSSLNWVQVSSQTEGGETVWEDTNKAQLWDYGHLQDGDVADKSELTANNGWLFPVRPPDGTPHLKYVELSTLSSITGGGGGGGECSCDLSVTPASDLSSIDGLTHDLVQIADWTKDNWQTHTPIFAPDPSKAIVAMANRLAYTPFYLLISQGRMLIINNFFFYGRDMKTVPNYVVTQTGTYYLDIETNQNGYYFSRIVREANTDIPPAIKQNDDTHTYYPLWVVPSMTPTWNAGFPFDCRTMYITPFYSN